MLPHERSLVQRLEKLPFALVGVNSDADREELKNRSAREGLSWRSFWDGGSTSGPIAKAWNVSGWPTIYVIDASGVIRYKNVRGAELDAAVDHLLREMGHDPPPPDPEAAGE